MSYADTLMRLASEADAKADELFERNAASGLDREAILAEGSFARGQASGFRQAAYYLSIVEGTNAND